VDHGILNLAIMKQIITKMGMVLIVTLKVSLTLITELLSLFNPYYYKRLIKTIKLYETVPGQEFESE
jgi:hypothetical protein